MSTKSAADIVITDEMLGRRRAPAPARKPDAISPADVDAIFVHLRALKRQFGPKPNKHDLAHALIGACILEGFDTRAQIVGALKRLHLNQSHVVLTLNHCEGNNPGHHLWRRDDVGRYHLLDMPTADRRQPA